MQEIPLAVPSPLQEEKQFLETEVFSTISMRKFFWSSQGQPINQELLAKLNLSKVSGSQNHDLYDCLTDAVASKGQSLVTGHKYKELTF